MWWVRVILVSSEQFTVTVHVNSTSTTLGNTLQANDAILSEAAKCVRKSIHCFPVGLDKPFVTFALLGGLIARSARSSAGLFLLLQDQRYFYVVSRIRTRRFRVDRRLFLPGHIWRRMIVEMVVQLYDTVLFQHYHCSAVVGSPMSTAPNFAIIAGIVIPVALVYQVEPVATAFGTAD